MQWCDAREQFECDHHMLGVPTGGVLPRTAVIADFVRLVAVKTHTCLHATLQIKTFRAYARDFRPEPKESAYTWQFVFLG